MAFTTPATLQVSEASEFVLALADEDPLATQLENCNHLYAHYIPPIVDVVWTSKNDLTRQSSFEQPIVPSADDLRYNFRTLVRTGTGTGTLTITLEEWDAGAWNVLDTTAAIAAAANSVIQHDVTSVVVSATSTKMRFTYARAGGDPYYAESALVWPAPATPVTGGVTASGFIPYDSGLLTAAGAPITTEHVNRCKISSVSVLTDRVQTAMSFGQEDNRVTPASDPRIVVGAGTVAHAADDWNRIGKAVWPCPGQKNPTLDLKVLAQVDGGAVSELVRISQAHPQGQSTDFSADFAATVNLSVATGTLELITDGGPDSHAVLELWAKHELGQTTTVHAATAHWTPGD